MIEIRLFRLSFAVCKFAGMKQPGWWLKDKISHKKNCQRQILIPKMVRFLMALFGLNIGTTSILKLHPQSGIFVLRLSLFLFYKWSFQIHFYRLEFNWPFMFSVKISVANSGLKGVMFAVVRPSMTTKRFEFSFVVNPGKNHPFFCRWQHTKFKTTCSLYMNMDG